MVYLFSFEIMWTCPCIDKPYESLKKKKGNPVITSHSSCCEATGTYWKLLNLVMVPSVSPLQQQPRFHPRLWGGFRSPLWWVPPSLAEGNHGDCRSTVNVRQEMKKAFFARFGGTFQLCFLPGEGFPGASFWHGWSWRLLIQSAYFQADVNHTSASWLYSLQYVKLEIAQETSGNYLIYLEL